MAEKQIARIKGLSDAQLRKLAQKPTDTVYVKAAAPWTLYGSYTPEVTEKGLAARQLSRRAAIQKSNAADKAAFHKKMVQMTKQSLQAPLRAELQTSKAEIAQLKAELKTAREQFVLTDGSLKTALADHKRTIDSLNAETKGTLNENVITIEKLEQIIKDYVGQIGTLSKRLSTLSHIESTSKKQAQAQAQNVLSLQTELSEARAQLVDNEAAMEKVISLHAKEIEALRSTDAQSAKKLEQQLSIITELNSTIEAQATSILELNRELIELKNPFMDEHSLGLGKAPMQQQQQSTKIAALKDKIAELNGQHEEEIEHMTGTISKLQAQLQRQKSRKEVVHQVHQPAGSNYQENIRQLTSKNVDLNKENEDLKQEFYALEQKIAKLEKQGSQRQKTRRTLKASDEEEINTLKMLLEEERLKNKTCESNLRMSTSNAEKLMVANETLKSTLEEYDHEFSALNQNIIQLKDQLYQLQTEHDNMLLIHEEQKDRLQRQLQQQRQQKHKLNDAYMRRQ